MAWFEWIDWPMVIGWGFVVVLTIYIGVAG